MASRFLFSAGAGYFVAMSAAHWFGFKVPILFIYYDVPSTDYQDKIISFCAASFAVVFTQAARSPEKGGQTAVACLSAAVIGLSLINVSDALRKEIGPSKSTAPYWLQTGLIAGLVGVLAALSRGADKKGRSN